ncbi:hypothetical protein BT96DRAFT_929662 [Gymnopus androsaceus JB14]|uniref:Uncharacterized protein n=1 Tax=Gymnopus androsaceus JB14 TaxID=1447944 RepID=A0A6A4GE29_9AGAR|nr:hypothetical protein BT96DRAFT_929662 [Gymnopus androsaceus JB14]
MHTSFILKVRNASLEAPISFTILYILGPILGPPRLLTVIGFTVVISPSVLTEVSGRGAVEIAGFGRDSDFF